MLILSRKKDESIVIGENIRVTVTRIAGNRVILAVEAPENIPIRRDELDAINKHR